MAEAKLFPGEEQAIQELFRLADKYGYGNFICRLQERWGVHLKEKWGCGDGSPHLYAGHAYVLQVQAEKERDALTSKLAQAEQAVDVLSSGLRAMKASLDDQTLIAAQRFYFREGGFDEGRWQVYFTGLYNVKVCRTRDEAKAITDMLNAASDANPIAKAATDKAQRTHDGTPAS